MKIDDYWGIKKQIEPNTGREIADIKIFKQESEKVDGPFEAISEATKYLRTKGYTIGKMCYDLPIGFAKTSVLPAIELIPKWEYISRGKYHLLDGIIVPIKSDDRYAYRDSWVKVIFFKKVKK